MQIYSIPVLSDNYIFLLYDRDRQIAAVVDPAEARPVLQMLEELGAELVAIFNTHHHGDHVGGNAQLLARFPSAIVYGGEVDRGRIPGQQVFLKAGDRIEFSDRSAEILFVPGHTRAHIAYYFAPTSSAESGELFCGDTLFSGGCGRLFEGTPEQMVRSLSQIRALPDQTRIWCAHEYTLNNLKFALAVDRGNAELQRRFKEVQELRSHDQATIPSMLGTEKQTNPFLRWDTPAIQRAMQRSTEVETFAELRRQKDRF